MRLDSYLRQRRLTAAELGRRAGVSKQAMSRYRRGLRMPRPEVMHRITEATDGWVTVADFYRDPTERRRSA